MMFFRSLLFKIFLDLKRERERESIYLFQQKIIASHSQQKWGVMRRVGDGWLFHKHIEAPYHTLIICHKEILVIYHTMFFKVGTKRAGLKEMANNTTKHYACLPLVQHRLKYVNSCRIYCRGSLYRRSWSPGDESCRLWWSPEAFPLAPPGRCFVF